MSDSLLITNALAVNEGRVFETDLWVRGQRIERLASDLSSVSADRVIDANGRYLLPGMIDDQVHFRDPGQPEKGTFRSESAASVVGGTTTVMDMPNNQPPVVTRERLEEKIARASGEMYTNHAFYFGATNRNPDETAKLDASRACGLKIFMGASTGNMLVDDPKALGRHFADCPILIATHCEDTPMIEATLKTYQEKYGADIPLACHPLIRSREACLASSSKAIELARRHDAQLHVLHLTTRDELPQFQSGPIEGKQITAEACVHHLLLTDADYEQYGGRIKCNPAIKEAADRDALRQAVREDRIDVIATDHAPHTLSDKEGAYHEIGAGLPYTQHALVMLLELVHQDVLSLAQAVHKVTHAPAIRYRLKDRGYLREGCFADLVLADLSVTDVIDPADVRHHVGWSAFEGQTVHARIDTTVVSGRVVWDQGQLFGEPAGQLLEFTRR